MIYFYKDNLNNPITLKDIPKECWEFIVRSEFLKQVEKFDELFSFSDYYKISIVISENLKEYGKTEYKVNLKLNNRNIGFIMSAVNKITNSFLIASIREEYDFLSKLIRIARKGR